VGGPRILEEDREVGRLLAPPIGFSLLRFVGTQLVGPLRLQEGREVRRLLAPPIGLPLNLLRTQPLGPKSGLVGLPQLRWLGLQRRPQRRQLIIVLMLQGVHLLLKTSPGLGPIGELRLEGRQTVLEGPDVLLPVITVVLCGRRRCH